MRVVNSTFGIKEINIKTNYEIDDVQIRVVVELISDFNEEIKGVNDHTVFFILDKTNNILFFYDHNGN
jgi:hypothetical protein